MDVAEQRRNAKKFIEEWKDRGREKQDSQSFWLSLLRNVLEIEKPEEVIRFEEKVKLTHDSFIDGYIDQTHTMIEQKGSNKDLDKAIRQSDGSLLTPFQQAQRYSMALPYSKRPRWIVTCNFLEFRVYDMEHPNSEPTKIELKDLATNFYQLDFLIDKSNEHLEKEKQVSLSAGELVGKIYDELFKQYKAPSDPHSQKSINQLCVRIVFCLYAEDSGIFGKKNMFHDYLEDFDARHTRKALINLFKVLDTKVEDRDPYLADDEPKLAEFPYVNGGMFSDEDIEIPPFTDELRNLLLKNASDDFDWSDISPTIFGAVFESTLNPETRRQGGMHYTSVENIHKVIDPLFLNDLKNKLSEIKKTKQPASLKRKAQDFQTKLANLTFFDPACGSGNFLTETYLQLRKLENEAIKLIYPNPELDVGQAKDIIKVSIQQFFGIEINDFAVSVAKTALWIAESQMWEQTKDIFFANWDFLPLKTYTHIHEGNALTMDWNKVLPNYACRYVMGNPPFIGSSLMSPTQKQDLEKVTTVDNKKLKGVKKLDYVAGWYFKTASYMSGQNIECAYVSTNSISQGEQVSTIWNTLSKEYNITINFAYRTFIWNSETKEKAHVHVVIICFSNKPRKDKFLYESNGGLKKVKNISGYLIDSPNVYVVSRGKPICPVNELTKGNQPSDGGNLILDEETAKKLIAEDSQLKPIVKRYIGGRDYLHNDEKRYCLWLKGAEPTLYANNKLILQRLKAVKEFREKSTAKPTRDKAQTPYLFFSSPQKEGKYIVIPRVSSQNRRYIPMGIVDDSEIIADSLSIVKLSTLYEFGVLESNVHMAWMRTVAGRLKSDYRYSGRIVYNNFPWASPTDEQKKKIEKTAQAILDARALYPNSSLADLYDPLTMPKELIKAHQDNDRAVMEAYGLSVKDTTESDAVAHLFKMYERLTKKEKNDERK